ncbi:MAG: tetratricopeptide repeat protein, partial [Candidatus Delongbacteria bacterium]|nr:tetratricopeptide repeat protein [Candidatus Delongbacteria bacterium]MCG2760872.1 tetratricopeptide repeat protein [Candidatus Delongbacteria bacterium]
MRTFFLFIIFLTFSLNAITYLDAKKGEKEYEKGNFDVSEKKFESASSSSTEKDPVLFYNLGNSLFQQKKYDDALNKYEEALSTDNKKLK